MTTVYFDPLLSLQPNSTCWTNLAVRCRPTPVVVAAFASRGSSAAPCWQRRSLNESCSPSATPEDRLKGGAKNPQAACSSREKPVIPSVPDDQRRKRVIVGQLRCSLLAATSTGELPVATLRDSFPGCVRHKWTWSAACRPGGSGWSLYCDLQRPFAQAECLHVRLRPRQRGTQGEHAVHKWTKMGIKESEKEQGGHRGAIVMYRLGIRCGLPMEGYVLRLHPGRPGGFHFTCRHLEQMGERTRATRCWIILNPQWGPSAPRAGRRAIRPSSSWTVLAKPCLTSSRGGRSAADRSPEEVGDSSDDGGCDSSVSDGLPAHFEFMCGKRAAAAGGRGVGASAAGKRAVGKSWRPLLPAPSRSGLSSSGSQKADILANHCGSAVYAIRALPTAMQPYWRQGRSRRRRQVAGKSLGRHRQAKSRRWPSPMATTTDDFGPTATPGRIRKRRSSISTAAATATSENDSHRTPWRSIAQAGSKHGRPQPMPIKASSPLVEQSPTAQRTMHYGRSFRLCAKPGVSLERKFEQVESAAEDQRQPRRRRPSAGGAATAAAALGRASPGVPSLAAAAALTESGTGDEMMKFRQLFPTTADTPPSWHQTGWRMRHRFAGDTGSALRPSVTTRPPRPRCPSRSVGSHSVAQTATQHMATTNRRSLVAGHPGPSSVLSAAAQPRRVAEASTSGFKTAESPAVRSGDEPEPAAEQLLPNRVESGKSAPLLSSNQRLSSSGTLSRCRPEVAADGPRHRQTAETIKTTTGVDAVMTAEASSCSETGPSSHSSPKQQQHQRRPSQWRQPPVGQEDRARRFSQPTVVLSSGNKPPAGHYQPADAGAPPVTGRQSVGAAPACGGRAARRMSQFRATDAANIHDWTGP
uniref:SH2 domain-containing protein n=1 Tax=Macrostomum lignano TaxID=282301 RepID=A0A1I8JPI1_9PLAT